MDATECMILEFDGWLWKGLCIDEMAPSKA